MAATNYAPSRYPDVTGTGRRFTCSHWPHCPAEYYRPSATHSELSYTASWMTREREPFRVFHENPALLWIFADMIGKTPDAAKRTEISPFLMYRGEQFRRASNR
ncbi:hypothetical protein [Paraburkholderia sp.]|uniref:hypothetical protein n=1 Tax=Paraburkholderia sp. TaxID=1926495 RepID=UPI0039E66C5A